MRFLFGLAIRCGLASIALCASGDLFHTVRATEPKSPSSTRPTDMDAAMSASWQPQLEADLAYLASDELSGRSVTDESIHTAANYIAERFKAMGLETKLYGDSPLQPVTIRVGAEPGQSEKNRITFVRTTQPGASEGNASVELAAKLGESMNPMAIGAPAATAMGKVIFAGYGITAPEFGYDDYAGMNTEGAIVVVLRKEPANSNPKSLFDGTKTTSHSYFATKVSNAIAHKAAALVIVNDRITIAESVAKIDVAVERERGRLEAAKARLAELPDEAVNSRTKLQQSIASIESVIEGYGKERDRAARGLIAVSEAGDRPESSTKIPVIGVTREILDQLIEPQTNRKLEDIERQLDTQESPASFVIDYTVATVEVELKANERVTHNVLAVLPGRGRLSQETIVIGAHYDHVGMGGYGSLAPGTIAIHNGADDNASGTSAMLATASRLVDRLRSFESHRRVLFIAFTGEERGLLGSEEYIKSPRFPLSTTVAMINFDMVGRLRDNELTVYGTGSGDSLDRVVEQANFKHQFRLYKVASGYGPSDHQSFYQAGVPVLFFFTGLHEDYHRPSDDFDKIDFGGMFLITDMVSDVASQLAIQPSRPLFVQTNKGAPIRRQLTAFMGISLSDRGDHVVLSGLVEDGPAVKCGLRVGDRLERIGKTRIRTASDVIELVRNRSPGDTLDVEVTRDGETIETTVRLQSRSDG